MTTSNFFDNGIATIRITDWLDWANDIHQDDTDWRIVLPMLQRGSVWKPHQVIDFWDTLLRGMPLGSMMASKMCGNVKYFDPIKRTLLNNLDARGLSLLDGQQRTLAMLLVWPSVTTDMKRRVWIDLGEEDNSDHLFRFHFSTESHPFGFALAGVSGSPLPKLPVADRKAALAAYANVYQAGEDQTRCFTERRQALWDNKSVQPWRSIFPVNLKEVMRTFENSADTGEFKAEITTCRNQRKQLLEDRVKFLESADKEDTAAQRAQQHMKTQLKKLDTLEDAILGERTQQLYESLQVFNRQYMPVIEVPDSVFSIGKNNVEKEPALAVLFRRIGTGGTPLSNADYVYSVIKNRNPNCHTLVESLLCKGRISALFTPVTLVTTAVRLTAASMGESDYVRIDMAQFSRLLQNNDFLAKFNANIEEKGTFVGCLLELLETFSYRAKSDARDIGFPKHALCLLELPILETLLCWLQKQSDRSIVLESNRKRLIRFTLYCALTVEDPHKASTLMFKKLKEKSTSADFPEEMLIRELVVAQLSLPMYQTEYFCTHRVLKEMVKTPCTMKLHGWRRFSFADLASPDATYTEENRKTIEQAIRLYRRFWNRRQRWNYHHELLLWLQRDYVFRVFEQSPALPGAEDDTPYDYDHICPRSHWSGWTGSSGNNRIIDFLEVEDDKRDQPQSWHGDSIGNIRVWDNSINRSDGDGDGAPSIKLEIKCEENTASTPQCLEDSAIDSKDIPDWCECSKAHERTGNTSYWTLERTKAFQRAVEKRVFYLYRKFYEDLEFSTVTEYCDRNL